MESPALAGLTVAVKPRLSRTPGRLVGRPCRIELGPRALASDERLQEVITHEARHSVFRNGSFGNGSAMRVGPLGAYLHDTPADDVVAQADLSAEVTHSHPEGRAGAVAVALAAWLAARGREAAPPNGSDLLRAVATRLPDGLAVTRGMLKAAELRHDSPLLEAVETLGNGSRVSCQDTVPLALWLALNHLDSYERAVRKAIAAGGDTDTTAAIVGSIVAAYGGVAGIPQQWLALVEPIPAS